MSSLTTEQYCQCCTAVSLKFNISSIKHTHTYLTTAITIELFLMAFRYFLAEALVVQSVLRWQLQWWLQWSQLWQWQQMWQWLWVLRRWVPSKFSICMVPQFEWDRTFRHTNIEQYKLVLHFRNLICRLFVQNQQILRCYNSKNK